jgi:hypothetical protein
LANVAETYNGKFVKDSLGRHTGDRRCFLLAFLDSLGNLSISQQSVRVGFGSMSVCLIPRLLVCLAGWFPGKNCVNKSLISWRHGKD